MAVLHRLCVLLSISICLVFLKPSRGEEGQADGCTNDFMSVERMSRVIDNQLYVAPWNSTVIFPGINFTCSGTIQSLTFGANDRNNSHTLFPEIQLWRPIYNVTGQYYTLVDTINYNLTHQIDTLRYSIEGDPLLEFQGGDIIGFYQPPDDDSRSRAQLAVRIPQPVQTIYFRNANHDREFDINGATSRTRNPLVSVTSANDSQCIGSGFLTEEMLRSLVGLGEVGRSLGLAERQQITPDINFTCSGTITKWIIGALRVDNDIYPGPTLQLWRKTGDDTYTKLNETNITSEVYNNSWIYEYTEFSPIPFQSGDVLGIWLPNPMDTILRLRFESNHGPTNYFTEDTADIRLSDISSGRYHPLVSLEISVSSSSVTLSPTSSASISVTLTTTNQPTSGLIELSSSSTMMSPTSGLILTSAPETSVLEETLISSTLTSLISTLIQTPTPSNPPNVPNPPTQPLSPSPSPPGTSPPESQESGSSSVAAIGGGVGGAAILFVLLVIGGCLIVVYIRRKRSTKIELEHLPHATDLRNPVYGGSDSDNINIHGGQSPVEDETVYESPYTEYDTVTNNNEEQQPRPRNETLAEFDNPLYSDTDPVTFSEATFYEATDYADATDDSGEMISYVPTSGQRVAMEDSGNIYSTPEIETTTKSLESVDYAYVTAKTTGKKIEYFEESNIYWSPATNVSDLYEQLAQHKYREIPQKNIEVGSSLGSGQFGVVNRGRWLGGGGGGGGPVDVAIKTLRPGAKDEDRLKFLQEAAINGQFRHPNIVRLYGVVTVGEPVMIVLEFLPNEDLRQYLQSMKPQPSPSEQAQQAKLCLSFCQQISSGMCYLASKDFIHRDLAARNILVSENNICKVADFGMARDLEEDSYYISHGGQIPVKWTAPEALHYKKYSTASDVWSFGCLMYEIWSLGHKPFEGYTNAQVMRLVTEGYRLAPPPGCPHYIYSIMMLCWNPEKSQRPSFDSLCKSLKEGSPSLPKRETEEEGESQSCLLGAPLETSKDLYIDLQQTYLSKN